MAVAKNDITGDSIQTRANSAELEKNWDNIFPDREAKLAAKRKADAEYWAKVNAETKARLDSEQK
jgi:hypothetical protein